jgi:hypothetical protein
VLLVGNPSLELDLANDSTVPEAAYRGENIVNSRQVKSPRNGNGDKETKTYA